MCATVYFKDHKYLTSVYILLVLLYEVPAVSWMKSAAFSQYTCWYPNVGHSPLFSSLNSAMNWNKATSSSLPYEMAADFLFWGGRSCFGLFGDLTSLAFWRIWRLALKIKTKNEINDEFFFKDYNEGFQHHIPSAKGYLFPGKPNFFVPVFFVFPHALFQFYGPFSPWACVAYCPS